MNIYACVKQVPDTEAKIVPQGSGIDESGIKWIVNPYDEHGVEEALKLREKIGDAQVVVVCLGPERAQESIRTTLAMGADRALHIVTAEAPDKIQTAQALAGAIKNDGECQLVFAGIMAIDDCGAQVHIRLAHYLEAAVALNVTAFEWSEGGARVTREIGGGGEEKIELKTPAVVAVTKAINTPRYPTLPNIMKAKKKEIKKLTLAEVGVSEIVRREEIIELIPPAEFSGGKILAGDNATVAPELVKLLKDEAKVI